MKIFEASSVVSLLVLQQNWSYSWKSLSKLLILIQFIKLFGSVISFVLFELLSRHFSYASGRLISRWNFYYFDLSCTPITYKAEEKDDWYCTGKEQNTLENSRL